MITNIHRDHLHISCDLRHDIDILIEAEISAVSVRSFASVALPTVATGTVDIVTGGGALDLQPVSNPGPARPHKPSNTVFGSKAS